MDDDAATVSASEAAVEKAYRRAVRALCTELEVPEVRKDAIWQVPVFITHGSEDDTVDIKLGKLAAECLRRIGGQVVWKEYEGLEHWMRGSELSDIDRWVDTLGVSTDVAATDSADG